MAASRALLGVHWLTDVVAGVMLGWGWFLLCALAFGGRLQRLGEPAERAARRYNADCAATVSIGPAVGVRLGPFEDHPGAAPTELDEAHVVGEERPVLDVPGRGVAAGARRAPQRPPEQLPDRATGPP